MQNFKMVVRFQCMRKLWFLIVVAKRIEWSGKLNGNRVTNFRFYTNGINYVGTPVGRDRGGQRIKFDLSNRRVQFSSCTSKVNNF